MTVKSEVKDAEPKVPEKTPQAQEQSPKSPEKQEAQKPPEETQDQINWRKFRQERESERKAKEESDKRAKEKEAEASALKAAMESLLNKPNPKPISGQLDEGSEEETEDQRIEKKVTQAIEQREKQYQAERAKKEAEELPKKLSATFSDFNQVCSQENMDYLEYHYPEVWTGFKHAQGNFDVWAGLYKTIKRLVPNTDSRKEEARIEKNLKKPQSMSSPGMASTGDQAPMELTEQRRKDNWARMSKIMRGV